MDGEGVEGGEGSPAGGGVAEGGQGGRRESSVRFEGRASTSFRAKAGSAKREMLKKSVVRLYHHIYSTRPLHAVTPLITFAYSNVVAE